MVKHKFVKTLLYISVVITLWGGFCGIEKCDRMDKIQPEKAVEILARHGTSVSQAEAQEILDFMYMLANIALNQYLSDEDSRFIHPG